MTGVMERKREIRESGKLTSMPPYGEVVDIPQKTNAEGVEQS